MVERGDRCAKGGTDRRREAAETPSDRRDEVLQQLTATNLAVHPVWRAVAVTGGAAGSRHRCYAFTREAQAGVRRPAQTLKTSRQGL